MDRFTSRGGLTLPAVGFGTYRMNGETGIAGLVSALDAGYRLLDSAARYDNEATVGEAVRRSGVPRDEVIVTSKLPGAYHRHDLATAMIEESLLRTGLDHLDLYLIHWPNPSADLYVEAWSALIEARERGLVRAIGVSNFLPEHLERLRHETGVVPEVNQIEMHPYFPQAEQRAYHEREGIVTEAWSPLGRPVENSPEMLDDPVIGGVAAAHGVTPAQVVLRWVVQSGAIPLPKAASRRRQEENIDLFGFALHDEEFDAITALGRPDGRTYDQDPARHEEY
ncbi:aldo/keto reductase [Herbiconiux moechotypicola]|uniref:Aldo/keto reductase n=1 Tax=Herbiconiux moechotypicola TaxID=637393 RepID=A0ABN3DYR7_9MICO|nr:aldo/keto reductase [Herbiconiux moechotypicola]MCS5731228.1 aldo/keto reductase [Herbiconiux moechotypicola]